MAYSATLANVRGLLSDTEHRRLLKLFSRAGLTMDHHQFDEHILDKGTKAILKTRDGLLRAVVPSPLGSCVFLNDVSHNEMLEALRVHKEVMKEFPRNGEGLDAFVDVSDTGETTNGHNGIIANGHEDLNGTALNGSNGVQKANGVNGFHKHASKVQMTNGMQNGHSAANGTKV